MIPLAFDIGANVGNWAIHNIHYNMIQQIISVEASQGTYEKLKQKTEPYKDRIIPLHSAVSNQPENSQLIFYESEEHNFLSTLNKEWFTHPSSRFYGISFKETICPSISIDKLIELYGKPNLIKIDVEGAEYECLQSLSQKVDMLCFEWASETYQYSCLCIDYLVSLGFTGFYIQLEDNYVFRPELNQYNTAEHAKEVLSKMTPRQEWGMLWAI